jgi:tetratricopeptide (TPR) repeat protein
MSDPFHIAARAIRSGRRICVDCGARYQLATDSTGEIECCDACRARRARLIERLSDKFHLIPKDIVPKARQESSDLQKCSDCGREFQPSVRGIPLDNCCEECHGHRVNMVDHLAAQTFRGWHPVQRKRRWFRSRRFWIPLMMLALLAFGAWLGATPAKHYYHKWREKKHFDRASAYFAKGDYRHAILDARNSLVFNFEKAEAIRIIAKSFEALHSTQALEWRARLGQLAPDDLENSLSWAAAAIRSGDYGTADRILHRIPYTDHGTALFHHLSAMIALNKRDSAKAEFHWSEAAKLNADEDAFKLNMAALRLRLGSAIERTNAIEVLNQLSLKSTERIPAMRALLSDALRHGENDRARQLAIALAEDPKAPFSDKLLRLSTLRTLEDPDFKIWRARLEAEASDRADYAYELLIWMNRNGYAKEVPALLPKIRPEFVSNPPVAIAVADSYAVAQDWPQLQNALKGARWFHMDYVRLATLAWAMEKSGDRTGSAAVWKNATTSAEGRLDRMETLARAATSWGWDQRAEEALWSITTISVQSPTWVLQTLWIKSLRHGDTDKLRRIARLMLQANPKSVASRNNYIFLSLLKRTEEGSPHEAAEALYKENPVNTSVISTYALSLFQLGRPRAASEIMETLTPAQLREPSFAIYYGIFLAGAQRMTKAEEFLRIGESWPLLPEEEAMLERVMQKTPAAQQPASPAVPAPKTSAPSRPSMPGAAR